MAGITRINDLPNDMFSSFIFPLLQHDRSTLLNLALASRRFKDLAEPFVYKTITFALRPPTKESHYDTEPENTHTFNALVSTLNAHPYLCPYILSLSISDFRHPYYTRFYSHSSLLSLTHNLRSLDLSPPPSSLSLAASDYPHLHTLRFNFQDPYDEEFKVTGLQSQGPNFKVALVARHFFLPSLRNFHIEGVSFLPKELGLIFFPPELHGTSRIDSLELMKCFDTDIGCLPDTLKCIKSLQRFIFEADISWEGSYMNEPTLTARSFALALKPFEHELTQLCIAASDSADFLRGSGKTFSVDEFGRGQGFRNYVNLRILAVPEFFLVNDRDLSTSIVVPLSEDEASVSVRWFVDSLPQSIENLQIQYMHGFGEDEDPHREVRIRRLEELARMKGADGASFSKLKKVVWWMQMAECWFGDEEDYGPISGLVALKEVFNHVGVDFEWVSEPYWKETPFGEGKFGENGKIPTPTLEIPIASIGDLSIH